MDRTTFSLTDETRRTTPSRRGTRRLDSGDHPRGIEEKVERLTVLPPKPRGLGVGASGVTDTARRSGKERPEPRWWR